MTCPHCGAAMMSWFTQGRTWFSCALCHDFEEQCRRAEEAEKAQPTPTTA